MALIPVLLYAHRKYTERQAIVRRQQREERRREREERRRIRPRPKNALSLTLSAWHSHRDANKYELDNVELRETYYSLMEDAPSGAPDRTTTDVDFDQEEQECRSESAGAPHSSSLHTIPIAEHEGEEHIEISIAEPPSHRNGDVNRVSDE